MSVAVGFRQCGGWSGDFAASCAWAVEHGFAAREFTADQLAGIAAARAAGLAVSSVDLVDWDLWPQLLCADESVRRPAVVQARDFIAACADALGGPLVHVAILIPRIPWSQADVPDTDRRRALEPARRSFDDLTATLAANDARLAIEGWPGPECLGCTPESLRALLADQDPRIGVNYDPSHLLRQDIDPLRFVAEFAARIHHVHAKDCELFVERIYDHGREIGSTAAADLPWGGPWWRYCIPGQGQLRWRAIIAALADAGYRGPFSIELEDRDFNGDTAREQRGLLLGKAHLEASC